MTTETLITEGQNTTGADQQQAASPATEGQTAAMGEQAAQQQQPTDGQTEQGQTADAGNPDGEAAAPQGAPDQYEFKPAEGVTFDDAVLGAFSEVAKELNLPQESAQKVLDKVAPVLQARQNEQIEAARNAWAESAKADKEFGGDKLQENLGVAKQALETFGTPELRTLLNETGFGNHPEFIRLMYRAGKAISEDQIVTGAKGGSSAQSVAQRMYPNMNP